MYTNTIRYTGTSGVDTQSMIESLMEAESYKYNRLYKSNLTNQYKQEAYRTVGNSLYDIQKNHFDILGTGSSNFRKSSTFTNFSSSLISSKTGSESNSVKVTPNADSPEKEYEISVSQLAKADKYTFSPTGINTATANNAPTGGLTVDDELSMTVDGNTKTISFTQEELDAAGGDTATALQNKIDETFGSGKVTVSSDSGKLSFKSSQSHTFSMKEVSEGTLDKLGFTDETSISTSASNNTSLSDLFGVTGDISFSLNGKEFSFSADDTMKDFKDAINNSDIGVKVSFSNTSGNMELESSKTGVFNAIEFNDPSNFFNLDGSNTSGAFNGAAAHTEAQDSIINFNGTTVTRSSNEFTLDGVGLQLNSVTEADEVLNLKVTQDNDATKENILKLVEVYNSILDTIYDATGTNKPKSESGAYYEPLTAEERDAMTDTEQENWDEKAKEGLLYNDTYLNAAETELRKAMSTSVTLEDGSKLSLLDIGISTGDWSKKGRLVVDEEALDAALLEHGDKIGEMFTKSPESDASNEYASTGIAERLNNALNNIVGSNGSITKVAGLDSSPLSLKNNTLQSTIDDGADELKELLDYLKNKENTYYLMFSKMEQSINESNSQMSYLTSLIM